MFYERSTLEEDKRALLVYLLISNSWEIKWWFYSEQFNSPEFHFTLKIPSSNLGTGYEVVFQWVVLELGTNKDVAGRGS